MFCSHAQRNKATDCAKPSAKPACFPLQVITAQPGQKINITLFDFGLSGATTGGFNATASGSSAGAITSGGAAGGGGGTRSNKRTNYPVYCQQYARIEEKDVARSTIVCGGERREKNVYISVTHEVEVHIMNRRSSAQQHYFLLKYSGEYNLLSSLSSCSLCHIHR